ncbi:MAG: Superoxide dismutase [Parcubacteria group bacterium GW2011_GWC1_38_22]|nr:MAG: Superoxide dismutase [Parcubacteria group bacterium GW2011_GWC1_38_22]
MTLQHFLFHVPCSMFHVMTYEAKKFDLLGIEGLSDNLLQNHFGLYEGYVKNSNLVLEELKKVEIGTPEYAELKRRFGWEFDGMRMHELYFGNLMKGGSRIDEATELKGQMEKDFGSVESWEKDFLATLAMRGIGWAVLYYDIEAGRLFNTWIGEHDAGHLVTCAPLLVVDAFEHAYMTDYGTKRPDYIEAIMKVLCYHVVEGRFKLAK